MGLSAVQLAALGIFVIIYVFIIAEKIDRAVVTLIGATILVLAGLLTGEDAIHFVDFETLSLLVAMMALVAITKRSGLFQYVAFKLIKVAKGNPVRSLMLMMLLTGVASALLDNVTTVVMIVPVTFVVCNILKVTPVPFLMGEILASNIGGTATLIGDPPNIMIGSSVGLGFMDFLNNVAPVALIIFAVTMWIIYLIYRKSLRVAPEVAENIKALESQFQLTDKALAYKSIAVLCLTFLGFLLHQMIGLETATVAIIGALLLLLISKVHAEEILREVEWSTIFFFAGLFIMVGALEKVGILDLFAGFILKATKGDMAAMSSLTLWGSGVLSGFVDNIPYVATAIPIIKDLGANQQYLWWALSLGACLGGNMTAIGASANVVVIGLADKNNVKISFIDYLKLGVPLTLLSLAISQVYLYVRYLL